MTDISQAPAPEQPEPITDVPQDTPDLKDEGTEADPPPKTELELLREEKAKALKREERRVNALTRRAAEAEANANAAARRIAELESKASQSANAVAKPRLEDFKLYDDYMEALADWKSDQKVNTKLQEFRQNELKGHEERAQEAMAQRNAEAFGNALLAVEEAGKKSFPDFVEAVTNGPRLGPMVGRLVMQSEKAPEITYYLAKNPDVGLSIAEMEPGRAAMEIGRLEARLANRKTTQAPPPTPEVGSRSQATKWTPDDTSGSTADWITRRNKQLKAKGG